MIDDEETRQALLSSAKKSPKSAKYYADIAGKCNDYNVARYIRCVGYAWRVALTIRKRTTWYPRFCAREAKKRTKRYDERATYSRRRHCDRGKYHGGPEDA